MINVLIFCLLNYWQQIHQIIPRWKLRLCFSRAVMTSICWEGNGFDPPFRRKNVHKATCSDTPTCFLMFFIPYFRIMKHLFSIFQLFKFSRWMFWQSGVWMTLLFQICCLWPFSSFSGFRVLLKASGALMNVFPFIPTFVPKETLISPSEELIMKTFPVIVELFLHAGQVWGSLLEPLEDKSIYAAINNNHSDWLSRCPVLQKVLWLFW